MKFTVSLNAKKIRTLFRFPCDYIDVHMTANRVLMFAETADIFSAAMLPVDTLVDYEEPVLFRIPKTGFLSLLEDGIVSFLCDSSTIYTQLISGKSTSNMKFDMQICSVQNVQSRLSILAGVNTYPMFDLADLILPVKLLKNSPYPITIENKYAFSTVNGLQLYAKTKCKDCAVFPAALSFLIANCDDFKQVYDVKNFIVYSDGIYHVMINKANSMQNSDIQYILKQPVRYQTTVEFEDALRLLARVKNYTEVDLSLRRQELILKSDGCEFSAKIKLVNEGKIGTLDNMSLEELLSAKVQEVPTVSFPAEVFKNIIYTAKTRRLGIKTTKKLVRVSVADGLMFVCRKMEGAV